MTSLRSGRPSQVVESVAVNEFASELLLEREMGCTRAEFVRWLPGATRFARMQVGENKAVVHAGNATVEIDFAQAPPRQIAAISMPVLMVSFRFFGACTGDYREFMKHFDLYTRRGGG